MAGDSPARTVDEPAHSHDARHPPVDEANLSHPTKPGKVDIEQIEAQAGLAVHAAAAVLVAIAFSAFQLVTRRSARCRPRSSRAVHVGFLVLVVFALMLTAGPLARHTALGWTIGLVGFAIGLYSWMLRGGPRAARRRV